MLKVHHDDDHQDLYRSLGGRMWTFYDDRYHVKSAASEAFSKDELKALAPDKDHFMVHLIAMGDQETFGPNRNGDGWPTEGLRKRAHTFVDNGCFYREHRNRDPETQGIGVVKAAKYYPDMHRVEIVVHGHRKKAAEEYEMARSGDPLAFSMSARVPDDRCNCCGNVARSPREYCTHLKSSMLQYVPEFKKYAFAINDEPTFFDISRVAKPADRIAYYIDYAFPDADMRKAASEQTPLITGTQWAEYEGVCVPDEAGDLSLPPNTARMLEKLAAAEEFLRRANTDYFGYHRDNVGGEMHKTAFATGVVPYANSDTLPQEALDAFAKVRPATLFYGLAKRACILPFIPFAAYVQGQTLEKAASDKNNQEAIKILPTAAKKIKEAGCSMGLDKLMGMFNSDDTGDLDPGMSDEVSRFMDMAADRFSVDPEPVRRKVIKIVSIKIASENKPVLSRATSRPVSSKAAGLAELYTVYRAAALADMSSVHGLDAGEPQQLLAAGHGMFFN